MQEEKTYCSDQEALCIDAIRMKLTIRETRCYCFRYTFQLIREGINHKKDPGKVWPFAKLGGGSWRVVKCQTSILGS